MYSSSVTISLNTFKRVGADYIMIVLAHGRKDSLFPSTFSLVPLSASSGWVIDTLRRIIGTTHHPIEASTATSNRLPRTHDTQLLRSDFPSH